MVQDFVHPEWGGGGGGERAGQLKPIDVGHASFFKDELKARIRHLSVASRASGHLGKELDALEAPPCADM